jgi:hypothetical protein
VSVCGLQTRLGRVGGRGRETRGRGCDHGGERRQLEGDDYDSQGPQNRESG